MYIKQSALFTGTSMDFVKKFMDICEMSSHKKGEVLFRENDPANFFFHSAQRTCKIKCRPTATGGLQCRAQWRSFWMVQSYRGECLFRIGRMFRADQIAENRQ